VVVNTIHEDCWRIVQHLWEPLSLCGRWRRKKLGIVNSPVVSIMHRLVEIGAVRFRPDGRELATFQQLIDPQAVIPEDVQQVHGITDIMVQGQPTIKHVLPRFIEFLGPPDTILLAHNAPFDLGFLVMALIRLGIAYPVGPKNSCMLAKGLNACWDSPRLTPRLSPRR
jgi:DNA polymerase III epsilon subunit-like protein